MFRLRKTFLFAENLLLRCRLNDFWSYLQIKYTYTSLLLILTCLTRKTYIYKGSLEICIIYSNKLFRIETLQSIVDIYYIYFIKKQICIKSRIISENFSRLIQILSTHKTFIYAIVFARFQFARGWILYQTHRFTSIHYIYIIVSIYIFLFLIHFIYFFVVFLFIYFCLHNFIYIAKCGDI